MPDGRRNNGGHSTKGRAGRKKKADEIAMIQRMDAILAPDEAWQALADRVQSRDTNATKVWLAYRYGQPKQSVDLSNSDGTMVPNSMAAFYDQDRNNEEESE